MSRLSRSASTSTTAFESKIKSPTKEVEQPKISNWSACFNLVKCNTGSGVLALPYAFSHVENVFVSTVFYIIIAGLCIYNMLLLLKTKSILIEKKKITSEEFISYGEVGKIILGKYFEMAINALLVLTQFGFCCVYVGIISTNIFVVLPEDTISQESLIFMVFPFLLILSYVRNMKQLTPFSMMGIFAIYSSIIIVFYFSFDYLTTTSKSLDFAANAITPANIAIFYGNAVYSFESIGLILPIENEMKTPARFPTILSLSFGFMVIVFTIVGLLPVLCFGEIDSGSITATIDGYYPSNILISITNIFVALCLIFSFPLMFFPAIQVVEQKTLNRFKDSERKFFGLSYYNVMSIGLRSIITIAITAIALVVTDIGLLVGLVGAVGSSMLALVFPSLMYVKLRRSELSTFSIALHLILSVLGVVGMIVGTGEALNAIIKN